MSIEMETVAVEYSSHLAHWKAAFQQLATQQPGQPRVGEQVSGNAVSATLSDGSANPYAAVLSGLQGLLEGPLFKAAQQPDALDASTLDPHGQEAAAAEDEEEGYGQQADEELVQQSEQVQQPSVSAARSPPGSRRPRKRQAASSQDSQEAAAVAAAAASPAAAAAGRPPSAKKRRNSQAPTQHVPASASLTDLANLAAAVAEESFDDPVLGDQEQQQDQGMMLAAYASGSLGGALSVQPETGATGGRGARGGSRARQRTPAPSSSGADEGDSLGMSFPLVNEDGKPLTKQQIKRLRRQQSNRESARRSRQRKAEEANMLAHRVGEMEVMNGALQTKNATLETEVQQLRSIIDMMASDSSTLAAQVGELGGTVSAEIMANVNWLVAARGNWSGNTPHSAAGAEHGA